MTGKAPTAEILSIGSEILLGETVDTNAAFLGGELARAGLALISIRALADDRAVLAEGFRTALARVDVVIATGGLGPTHDDLTREGVADALAEQLSLDPALEDALRTRMTASLGRMPANNLRQAMRIPSAVPLPNPIGSAPGWWVEHDGHVAAVMPGVPSEMRRMWTDEVAGRLAERFSLVPLAWRTVKTFGVGESRAAEMLGSLLESDDPLAGIYARDDGVHVRFSTRGDGAMLDAAVAAARDILGDGVWGTGDETLPEVALRALGHRGARTLAVHESETGGALLAIMAGSPSGAGARFVGGGLIAPPAVEADALLHVRLLPEDGHGRSRVDVSLQGVAGFAQEQLRIHGSGPQRLRRAAFAALDLVRRRLGEPL